jgi:S-adenosyl methyltransferase
MLWRVADPAKIDTSVPHPARVYDYWLGGKDNFEADRQAARAAIEIFPHTGWRRPQTRPLTGRW